MSIEKIYIGSRLKYKIEITGTGFDMLRDDFSVTLVCGKIEQEIPKEELITTDEGYFIPIDTALFPKGGDLYVVTKARILDSDFPGGYREEIDKQLIMRLNKL